MAEPGEIKTFLWSASLRDRIVTYAEMHDLNASEVIREALYTFLAWREKAAPCGCNEVIKVPATIPKGYLIWWRWAFRPGVDRRVPVGWRVRRQLTRWVRHNVPDSLYIYVLEKL